MANDAGGEERLENVLKNTTPGGVSRLRARKRGVRFNVEPMYRDYNSQTLALDFLDPVVQPRFLFASGGGETVAGEAVLKLQFAQMGGYCDLGDRSHRRAARFHPRRLPKRTESRHVAQLENEEDLVRGSTFDRICCVASDSNFRRLESFGRVVSTK